MASDDRTLAKSCHGVNPFSGTSRRTVIFPAVRTYGVDRSSAEMGRDLRPTICCRNLRRMDMLQFVRDCIARSTDRTLKDISDGARLGDSWFRMFARGAIPDPGYSKIKALSDYFMRSPPPERAETDEVPE
jgi:hypothetical protein